MCAASLLTHSRIEVGSGDDCAVLLHPDKKSVISTDVLVENHHFLLDWSTPYEVGARGAMQNMADIAAMGAIQHSAVVSVAVPKYFGEEQIQQLSAGLAETLEANGGALVGGDLTGAEQLVVSVTVIGDLEGRNPLLRTNAQPGDKIIFAGQLGWSPAGLEMFLSKVDLVDLPEKLQEAGKRAIEAYKVPQPPLHLARIAGENAHSMMDVSDGLQRDAGKIARGSKVALVLDKKSLEPYVKQIKPLADYLGKDAWDWVLHGGEDHGLVGTCAPENVDVLVAAGFHVLGEVKPASEPTNEDESGFIPGLYLGDELLSGAGGWDHFAN